MAVVMVSGAGLKHTPSSSNPAYNAFSIACWVLTKSIVGNETIIMLQDTAFANAEDIRWVAGHLTLDQTTTSIAFPSDPALGVWAYMAMTNDGTTQTGYWRDQHQTAFVSITKSTPASFTVDQVWFGSDSSNDWYDGNIAHCRVWNAALTSAELMRESFSTVSLRRKDLLMWLPVFYGKADQIRDFSGNGNDFVAAGAMADAPSPLMPMQTVTWNTLLSGGPALPSSGEEVLFEPRGSMMMSMP